MSIIIVVICLWLLIAHFDKVMWLKNIPKIIMWFITNIPSFLYIAYKATAAMALLCVWFCFTWGFWPLALTIIWYIQIRPYTH